MLETLSVIRVSPDSSFGEVMGEDHGDQPHVGREFHDVMGMTARDYARTPRALMQAAAEVQLQIPLSFALPEPRTD